jgi:hypothetical protein
LLGSGRRLLAYRAALTDAVVDVLRRQGKVSSQGVEASRTPEGTSLESR